MLRWMNIIVDFFFFHWNFVVLLKEEWGRKLHVYYKLYIKNVGVQLSEFNKYFLVCHNDG